MKRIREFKKYYSEEAFRQSLMSESILVDYFLIKVERNISIFDNVIIRCDAIIVSKDYSHWAIVELKILDDWEISKVAHQLINYCEIINEYTYLNHSFYKLKKAVINACSSAIKDDFDGLNKLIKNNLPFIFLISDITEIKKRSVSILNTFLRYKISTISIKKYIEENGYELYHDVQTNLIPKISRKENVIRIVHGSFKIPNPNFFLRMNFSESRLSEFIFRETSVTAQVVFNELNPYHSIVEARILESGIVPNGTYILKIQNSQLTILKQ